MIWNDSTVTDAISNDSLPKFDDVNVTPVKMRMKKSNGNVVDVDILATFLMEKLDADTLASLMSATSPITLSVRRDKVVIGVDGTIDSTAIVFNDNSAYADIVSAITMKKCILYAKGKEIYQYAGIDSAASLIFTCGNKTLTIDSIGNRTVSIGNYARVFTYGETSYSQSDFENCFAICDYNGNYLYEYDAEGPKFRGFDGKYIYGTYVTTDSSGNLVWAPVSKEAIDVDDRSVLVIGVNTTTYSIADLAGYDVVILNAGGVKHLMTELTSSKAVFSGSYLVGGVVVSRTYTYDGTNWTVNDAGSLYRVKVNANGEPQYLFNAITEGNGISITDGGSDSMTIASKTMVLTWRTAYAMSKLLAQDVLEVDVEGKRYHCIGKTDTKLTFARVDDSSIRITTYDGEVWSDVKETEVNAKQVNVLVFHTSTGIASFDPSLPTKVYVPDEEIFYDCTKYEESDTGLQLFTLTKDYNIFTTWAFVPGNWSFQGMEWKELKVYVDADPYESTQVNFELLELGQRVTTQYASTPFDVELNIGGVVFRNCYNFNLIGHDEIGNTFTAQLGDSFPNKLVVKSIERIEDITTEEIA